jgi:superfamily II DNA or RNA helicase
MASELLAYFQNLTPGQALLLGERRSMNIALSHFKSDSAGSFQWEASTDTLTATDASNSRITRKFQLRENRLTGLCSSCRNQGVQSGDFCVHLWADCMTILYCLRGSFMGQRCEIPPTLQSNLKAQLLSTNEVPASAEVPAKKEQKKDKPTRSTRKGEKKSRAKEPWICIEANQLNDTWRSSGPFYYYIGQRQAGEYELRSMPILVQRFAHSHITTENKIDSFLQWRSLKKNLPIPIVLRREGQDITLSNTEPVPLQVLPVADLRKGEVFIGPRLSTINPEGPNVEWTLLGPNFYYAPEGHLLGKVERNGVKSMTKDGWLRYYIMGTNRSGAVDPEIWNLCSLYIAQHDHPPLDGMSYSFHGIATPPIEGLPSPRFNVEIRHGQATVLGDFYFGEERLPICGAWRNSETQSIREMPGGGESLWKRKNYRQALFDAWAAWLLRPPSLSHTNDIHKFLRKHPAFPNTSIGECAIRALRELVALFDETTTLPFVVPGIGFWHPPSTFTRKVADFMAVARKFLGLESEAQEYTGWTMPQDKFHALLPEMLGYCQNLGIELRVDNLPMQAATFDYVLTATTSEKELDWFALTPEVRCKDRLIPQEEWEKIISAGGWSDGTTFHVVEAPDKTKLEWLGGLLSSHRGTGKKSENKSIAEVSRLRILDLLEMRRLGMKCHLPPEEEAILESLQRHTTIEPPPLPSALRATLRDYQISGYAWMCFLYRHRFGGCLADDMGLGKTLQTICFLAALHERIIPPHAPRAQTGPHLIVLPPTLIFNWRHELERFYPGLHVTTFVGKDRSPEAFKADVVLTSYEIVRRDIESLEKQPFHVLIFDEAQAVKNLAGERSKAMRRLKGRFRLSLTGTPMENHAGEYFSILELALPGLLGDHQKFRKDIEQGSQINPLRKAGPFVLRRTKDEILKDLPPKTESDIYLELDTHQKALYTRMVAEVRQEVLRAYRDNSAQQAGIAALAALLRLRQICISAQMLDKQSDKPLSPKLEFLLEKLEELQQEGQAALVFSSFTTALDLVEHALRPSGISWQRMDGKTPQKTRRHLVETFQKSDGPTVFLVSVKTGGAGLNLTRASHVFHLDPWWNPAVENQATDRTHRIGQERPVFVHRILMSGTIEEKMMKLKAGKRELCERILSGGGATRGGISRQDIEFLLER